MTEAGARTIQKRRMRVCGREGSARMFQIRSRAVPQCYSHSMATPTRTTPAATQRITPFLWFDSNAEEAVAFYTSIFKNSRVGLISRYSEAGREHHGRPPGSVMTIEFDLDGQKFTALNGGPHFKFTEAISFVVNCDTQTEIDAYSESLTAQGGKTLECGWLKDRFGLAWQIVPAILPVLLKDPIKCGRVMAALMQMVKLDIAKLQAAADGR